MSKHTDAMAKRLAARWRQAEEYDKLRDRELELGIRRPKRPWPRDRGVERDTRPIVVADVACKLRGTFYESTGKIIVDLDLPYVTVKVWREQLQDSFKKEDKVWGDAVGQLRMVYWIPDAPTAVRGHPKADSLKDAMDKAERFVKKVEKGMKMPRGWGDPDKVLNKESWSFDLLGKPVSGELVEKGSGLISTRFTVPYMDRRDPWGAAWQSAFAAEARGKNWIMSQGTMHKIWRIWRKDSFDPYDGEPQVRDFRAAMKELEKFIDAIERRMQKALD